jgi:hypothetical protein
MKQYALMSIVILFGPTAVRPEDAIPKRTDFGRYEAMVKNSPFAVATAPALASQAPSWSKDLYVANAAHTLEVDLVTLMSVSDKNVKEYLTTEKPNDHGYGIANIEWSEDPGATKVTISKDGQFATIGFNEALASQPNAGMPAGPLNYAPTFQKNPQNPQLPPIPMPMPHTRGVIQRNPNQFQQQQPGPVQPGLQPGQVPIPAKPPKSQIN